MLAYFCAMLFSTGIINHSNACTSLLTEAVAAIYNTNLPMIMMFIRSSLFYSKALGLIQDAFHSAAYGANTEVK